MSNEKNVNEAYVKQVAVDAKKGNICKFNHVLNDGDRLYYHNKYGNQAGDMEVGKMQSNNRGYGSRFKGEKELRGVHDGSYPTLVQTTDDNYYPRGMVLIKGVDYDD